MLALATDKMTSAAALLALVTTFGQLIDELAAHRQSFDFDVTAQIALLSTNDHPRAEVFGPYRTNCWRTILVPLPEKDSAALRSGDRVRLVGRYDSTVQGKSDTTPPSAFTIARAENLGRASFPEPRRTTGGEIANGLHLHKVVSVSGVLAAIARDESNPHFLWLVVRTDKGKLNALTTDTEFSIDELNGLKDAEIDLTGYSSATWGWRRFLGYFLMVFGREGLKITKSPPASPFDDIPATPDMKGLHRTRTSGTLIGIGRRDAFIREDGGMFLPVTLETGSTPPRVGTHVEVAGFAEPDQNNIRLVEAVMRPTGGPPARPEPAQDLDPALLSGERMKAELYGRIVRIRGTLTDPGIPLPEARSLIVRCGRQTVPLDITALCGQLDARLCGGCEVEVCGICSVVFEGGTIGTAFPEFKGILVIPRTAEDVRILRHAPWWTPARLLTAIGVILAGLLGAFVWVFALHRLAERRGRELFEERRAREEERRTREIAELRMQDRTRLAVELHDTISQNLTGATMQMGTAAQLLETDAPEAARHIDIATRTLDSCRQELRNCIWDLRNNTLDVPDLNEAIRLTIQRLVGEIELQIRFNIRREALSDNTVHALMRIVRELATNAVRHGAAKTVRVAGALEDGILRFSVTDDGRGFDPDRRPGLNEGHFGLQGVEERVSELGGEMKITSSPGKGTRVAIWIRSEC